MLDMSTNLRQIKAFQVLSIILFGVAQVQISSAQKSSWESEQDVCRVDIIMAPSKCRTRAITNFEIGYNPHKICIDNQLSAEKLPSNYTQPRAENMIQSEKWLPSKDIK